MVWSIDSDSGGVESHKVRWEIVPYTRGKVLDVGCGPYKCFPHFIGVDNQHHQKMFSWQQFNVDLVMDGDNLNLIATQSVDAVFSSHLLEHFEKPEKALKEWFRVIKPGGHLVVYYPHEDHYPKVGEKGANPDHKVNLSNDKVTEMMREIGTWDLVENQVRTEGNEYSAFQVFKKLTFGKCKESWKEPKPEKTAAVVRYGAFGDNLMASSVASGLKKQGYHVTFYGSPPGIDVMTNDPNIDRFIIQDRDQVPNANLGEFWSHISKKYDKFVNLSESVEGTFLAIAGRAQHSWPHELRHKMLNHNYLQFQHELAGIPHEPNVRFYATAEEKAWAKKQREKMNAGYVVLWSLSGSSLHKTYTHLEAVIARLMLSRKDAHVVLVGGPESVILEQGWEKEPRVHRTSGKWSIRQTLAFIDECDLVIGPETGVLNAASCLSVPKVVFLSHSSHENLTRDWVNTISLSPRPEDVPCYPCHQLHANIDGFKYCKEHKETRTAMCQWMIPPDLTWQAVTECMAMKQEAA